MGQEHVARLVELGIRTGEQESLRAPLEEAQGGRGPQCSQNAKVRVERTRHGILLPLAIAAGVLIFGGVSVDF